MSKKTFTFERPREEIDGRRHEYTVTELHEIELTLSDDGQDAEISWEWEDEGHPGSGDSHEIRFKFAKERTQKIDGFLEEEDAFYALPYEVYKWLMEQGLQLPEGMELPEAETEPEPVAAPALAVCVIGQPVTTMHLEIACLDNKGNAICYDSSTPETIEDARQIIAERKTPRGIPEYDAYWPHQNHAIRRVTKIVETLECDRNGGTHE